ncbi:5,6-dimethylbenzimidazole synthase [Bartonella tamiae]|uniref:Cob(II)yrinic acid a,c-diamide reductase n=1 Tax=Bartonella tamiae Th239 TaxID=1094558 RepID=J0ZR98_9HYPH|nr:5,6-dimethylbenzimidazole synthase [Bartonella tamiae]EJF91213.1 cob(II)yrinic acid a,c-diamide reductase [Bartonella tamiae Th239]EJF93122.1 cob(II)yrinic acid a,c-diamide reductase [Bartonella tamiae Th307]
MSDDIYALIKKRRDVRDEFLPKSIDETTLMRLLDAAHHAPSVGFQQPWNFILIRDVKRKKNVQNIFKKAQLQEATLFKDKKQQLYQSLKLEGIVKAPLNIVITCENKRDGASGLGRYHNPQMSAYSCACAVQNLMLAARYENIGVGWVSIYCESELRALLKIPESITIIAYLCLGYVSHFYDKPELEEKGWRRRMPLNDVIFQEEWLKYKQ